MYVCIPGKLGGHGVDSGLHPNQGGGGLAALSLKADNMIKRIDVVPHDVCEGR